MNHEDENSMVLPSADEVSMPEVEFIRAIPLQVGGLPARINLALADFHADKPDIDVMALLLEEWALLLEECLNTIETADKNFQDIVKRCESMSAAIDNLRAVVKVQA